MEPDIESKREFIRGAYGEVGGVSTKRDVARLLDRMEGVKGFPK